MTDERNQPWESYTEMFQTLYNARMYLLFQKRSGDHFSRLQAMQLLNDATKNMLNELTTFDKLQMSDNKV